MDIDYGARDQNEQPPDAASTTCEDHPTVDCCPRCAELLATLEKLSYCLAVAQRLTQL